MRNVTIVESNVEPNKEHLWFYNGKLKWFGPNGWEQVNSQASSPTTTPKPTGNSIEFINHTNVNIQLLNVIHSTGSTISPPIQPNLGCTLEYNDSNNGVAEIFTVPNALPFSFLKITAFKVEGQGYGPGYNVLYEHYQSSVGTHFYKFSFKELIEKGFTLVSINGNVSNSSDDTTTTSSLIPGSDVRFTNNTDTDIRIYGVLYNGDTASPPMQPGQTYILRYFSSDSEVAVYNSPDYMPFDSLKITAFRGNVQEEVPYITDTDHIVGVMYKFPEGLLWEGITEISIEGSVVQSSSTTTTPRPITTTTTSTRPPNGSGRVMRLYTGYGITHSLSTLMTSKDSLYDGLIGMEDKFYPVDEYNKAYYSTSGKYLAVVHSTEAKDTIVASIIMGSPSGSGKHTLYPKETAISGNTGHRFFLFDLSESPYLESTYDASTVSIELSAYTPDTISTIAPFIDGNIPPFADEK